jgi:hypothetical protein
MRVLVAILLLFPCHARCQSEHDESPEAPDPGSGEAGAPGSSAYPSPGLDSLYRHLAFLEVAKAREAVTSTNFWHRLIPLVSLGGGIGMKDLAFPDAGGTLVLPKDTYRLTLGLSLSALLDGSTHAGAELRLAEMETRLSILVRRQFLSRLSLERKRNELSAELEALRDELAVRRDAVACQELLFAQGRADFHSLAGARIDLIRLKRAVARLEMSVHDLEKALAGQ